MPVKEGEVDQVACHKTQSIQSPLSIIPDVEKLEFMTDEQILGVLDYAVRNEMIWNQLRLLLDKNVSKDNLKVTYMRTLLKIAGPIGGQKKRYESLEDD